MTDPVAIDTSPFETQHILSTGATGTVWAARGPEGEAVVKVARSPEHKSHLAREAKVLSTCKHPGLPRLLLAKPEQGWLALEFVPGIAADLWSEDRSVDEIIAMGQQVLRAMGHLHSRGVIHGDIKPGNVLVDSEGRARLVDLSAAQVIGSEPTGFRGTLSYVAPERIENAVIHPRMDVYGFGALLYRCIAGRPPFQAKDAAALGYLPLVSLPAPPSTWRADLSALVNQLVLALLTRTPERRPDDLDRISRLLDKAAQSPPAAPVLGMEEEREELRRAVVGARDGESRVVVVYGPPGSGRRTLITEAVEAARREGLTYPKGVSPSRMRALLGEQGGPWVVVVRRSQKGTSRLARAVLEEGLPALVLVHAYRPEPQLAALGAVQVTPPPLTKEHAQLIVRHLGADTEQASAWWRQSLGLPVGIVGRARRWLREHGKPVEDALPAEARSILEVLQQSSESFVPSLAEELGMSEHALLDHCEVLFAEGRITCSRGGASLRLVED